MSSNIRLKRSAIPGRVPTIDQVELGEIKWKSTSCDKLSLNEYIVMIDSPSHCYKLNKCLNLNEIPHELKDV